MCLLTIWYWNWKQDVESQRQQVKCQLLKTSQLTSRFSSGKMKTGGNLSRNNGYAYNLVEVLFTDLSVEENITLLAEVILYLTQFLKFWKRKLIYTADKLLPKLIKQIPISTDIKWNRVSDICLTVESFRTDYLDSQLQYHYGREGKRQLWSVAHEGMMVKWCHINLSTDKNYKT